MLEVKCKVFLVFFEMFFDCQTIYEVERHVRNLHEGYKASFEKIASAAERGIELSEHQTWVEEYTKGYSAA